MEMEIAVRLTFVRENSMIKTFVLCQGATFFDCLRSDNRSNMHVNLHKRGSGGIMNDSENSGIISKKTSEKTSETISEATSKKEKQPTAVQSNNRSWFFKGMKDGFPIAMGYFAVAFTLGIASKKAGLSSIQASLMSAMMLASAGQFAGIEMIAGGAGYLEMAMTTMIVNLRYLLMSSALSQKIERGKPFYHRLLMAYAVTDELFGISISVEGRLNPCYLYGAASIAAPGWVLGTFLGAVIGMILPVRVMNALNVALYGMFLAVVIPASKKSKIVAGVVIASMVTSALFSVVPGLREISSGFQMIILTILLAGISAILFPVKEEDEHEA